MKHGPTNLTNTRLGTWTGIRATGESCRYTASRIWSFRCDCGSELDLSVSTVRAYQRRGMAPRCECQRMARVLAAKSLPKRSFEPQRVKMAGKWNCYCCGLTWHIPPGQRCSCGLKYAPEEPIEIEFRSGPGPAQQCVEHAAGWGAE